MRSATNALRRRNDGLILPLCLDSSQVQEKRRFSTAFEPLCRFQERATHSKVRGAQIGGSDLDLLDLARAALLGILHDHGYRGWLVVEAEQDPAVAPSYEYAEKGFRTLRGIVDTLAAHPPRTHAR